MRTDRIALSYGRRAESRLTDARSALGRGSFPDAVRYSQECVEMSLKAVLRAVGIEYPKEHEVSTVLVSQTDRLPAVVSERVDYLAKVSSKLYDARGPAMYGDEEAGTPPEEIFTEEDARRSVGEAEEVYELCSSALEDLLQGGEA
ncbi:hypothetical protein AKJ39_01525 [candidate division MSBL1 archaeon SCGC-AAA259J03]|uniref:HEPN domain-containing protein n=1 Tax=candidate division MSBL1 archaeon SCGC-AAA259J03 TaxID=1698269 RepID=A0A656YWM8_9EURY|nr:hypothetical protein AKJ39_01525 [candidate division MSBL1 archaeon SCGC-AAA259J03]